MRIGARARRRCGAISLPKESEGGAGMIEFTAIPRSSRRTTARSIRSSCTLRSFQPTWPATAPACWLPGDG